MLRKSIFGQERVQTSKSIVNGAIVGGVLGAAVGFLYKANAWTAPGMGYIFKNSPVDVILTGTVLGIFIGAVINILIGLYITQDEALNNNSNFNHSKLQLREEQLEIARKRVQTGEVAIHKEILREEKNIIVPVTREELVIEKKVLDKEPSNKINEHTETIRIPISEERIEVIKHPVVKEEVAIYSRQLHETEHFEETLKKEKICLKTIGNPRIIDKEK